MLSHAMRRTRALVLLTPVLAAAAAGAAGCGEQDISLASKDPNARGAVLFTEHCGACHTLQVAGTQGSATDVRTREYKDGPNFNQRKEDVQGILYAIRNGGFSSGPMPQDILTGPDADAVAKFIEKYSGREAKRPPGPGASAPKGFPAGGGSQGQTGGGQPPGSSGSQGASGQ